MSNKQSRGKQQIPRKKCNEKNIKVAANSNVRKKRKQPQQLNSKSGLRLVDDLLPPDYILRKVFRKDGPPLGVEFDNLPSHAFRFCNVKGDYNHFLNLLFGIVVVIIGGGMLISAIDLMFRGFNSSGNV